MANKQYDALISSNHADFSFADEIIQSLRVLSITTYFEEIDADIGVPRIINIERGVSSSNTCVFLIGSTEMGSWQKFEMILALTNAISADDNSFVISVILPGSGVDKLPSILAMRPVVDCSSGIEESKLRLLAGYIQRTIDPNHSIDKEEIDHLQEILKLHRQTVAHYLTQQAMHTKAMAPPLITHGIHDARNSIRQIKSVLRQWGVIVKDHPNDEQDL